MLSHAAGGASGTIVLLFGTDKTFLGRKSLRDTLRQNKCRVLSESSATDSCMDLYSLDPELWSLCVNMNYLQDGDHF